MQHAVQSYHGGKLKIFGLNYYWEKKAVYQISEVLVGMNHL